MKVGKISGIISVIVGAALLYFSHYINTQVAQGRTEISSAQQKVDTGNTLFSVNPVTKEIGKGLSGNVQNRIDAGTREADQYAQYAKWCMIGGIALIVIGIGLFFI